MANIFKPKRSNVVSSVPTTSNLADGEMAVNSADKKIYLRDGSEVIEIANNSWDSVDGGIYTTPNVGIGTTNPTKELDVNGDINYTGNLYKDGQLVSPIEHKILDNISSSFNGSTTQFTISSSSINFLNSEITSAARLLISVGGVVQAPDPTQSNGYYISGGTDLSTDPIKINFVEAPKAGQLFFGVAYGLANTPSTSFVTAEQSIAYSIVFGV
jgi:hypothetical protein